MNLKFNLLVKIFFTYIFVFLIFYLEPISVFGIKFAILWKLPLVAFLAFYFLVNVFKNQKIEVFVFWGLLLSAKVLFSISSFQYFSSTLSEFTKLIIFFLLFMYIKDKYTYVQLERVGKHLSIFIILSFLPFIFNLLTPLGRSIELSNFGNLQVNSLVGIFQNPHSAGMTLSISILIIFYYLFKSKLILEKLFFLILILIGLSEVFLTFVRTPLAMLFVSFIMIGIKYFKLKHYIYTFFIIFSLSIPIYNSYENTSLIKSYEMRLKGENKYNDGGGLGSGRLMFWSQAIENWKSEGMVSISIGLGMELAKDKMEDATRLRVFAHNGYLQQLQADGIIGLILLIFMLFYMYKYIKQFSNNPYYYLVFNLYLMYLISMFFQGGNYFLIYVILAIYLSILLKLPKKGSKNV